MATEINHHHISNPLTTSTFTWTVEHPHIIWTGYANGTVAKLTYGNPGDSTLFVVMEQSDANSSAPWDGPTRFWTSPRYVIGSDPYAEPRSQ